MFCRCAFGQDSPPDGFMQLAIDAAELTGNLPLGLNVLGSSLAEMKKEEWVDTVPKLRNRMTGQIEKTLRDSYDRLKEEDKAIFRHIACLFNRKSRDYVTRLLEDSKLDVHVGLVTLADRCLIQISKDDKIIRMHDFLQNMGRDIVRQPCIQDPGEREFLMDSKEICDVLVDGTGTKRVLGIFLNLSEIEDTFSISQKAFRRMKNLRFLSIYGALRDDIEVTLALQGGEDHMWRQLRLLEWWGCSMRCMPPNFRPENLVELRMPDSHVEALWQGVQLLKSLKKIDLRRCKKLKEIPDLSKATNLEEMYLGDCCSLVMIPPSIQNLNRLRKLDMKRCINLQILPPNVDLESLHSLIFSGCSQLRSFPHISTKVSYLFLDETKIEEVPGRIEDMSELNYILMNGCSNLNYISPNTSKLKHLEVIFFTNSDSLVKATTTDNIHTQLPDASSSRKWKYDVFLSFLGKDVRRTLISYLSSELFSNGISISMDEIMGGEDVTTQLAHGIRESRIAIVVLSENYASSRWCLDELVEIIKCGEEIGQKVVPIFYDVDPIRIKKQILDLGKTSKTKSKTKSTVDKQQKWFQAFTVLTQIRGYHSRDWDNHAKMIGKIADDMSFALNITPKEFSDVGGREMLPRILDQETEKTLKLHYHGLNGKEKTLFRHIACFLNNERYENVTRLLEDSELDVGGSLKILYEKSLIQISEERVISMHDLLQKVGRDMVLGPFIHDPAKRQFLMDTTEGCDVLIDQTGAENVFGISFRVSEMQERLRRDEKFKGMKNLQFMRMYKETLYDKEVRVHLVKGLHSLWERLSNI